MSTKNKKAAPLFLTARFIEQAIKKSGRQPCLFDNPVEVSAATAPDGGLPLFYEYARKTDSILSDTDGWLKDLRLEPDPESLIGARLECAENMEDSALYPVVSLFYQGLVVAMEMTPDKGKIELSNLTTSLRSEVLHELSINGWPQVRSTENDRPTPR